MNEKQLSYFLENDWEVQGNEKQASKMFEFKNFKRWPIQNLLGLIERSIFSYDIHVQCKKLFLV